MREDYNMLGDIDTHNIKTKRELAMYIIGVCSQKDWSDGYCLDCIIDVCFQIVGRKPLCKGGSLTPNG